MAQAERTKIIAIDDDPVSIQVIDRICSELGFDVLRTSDPKQVIEWVKNDESRLVLSDWFMPKMNGDALCKKIRELDLPHYVFFSAISDFDDPDFLRDALLAQVDYFLPKPVSWYALLLALKSGTKTLGLLEQLEGLTNQIPKVQKRLERDLHMIRELQMQVQTDSGGVTGGVEHYLYSSAKSVVSGDLAGVVSLANDEVVFYLLDVVGHGVPAGIRALGVSRFLSDSSAESLLLSPLVRDDSTGRLVPSKIIDLLNRLYETSDEDSDYFCLTLGVLDTSTGEAELVLAGMPKPILFTRTNSAEAVGESDFPVGLFCPHDYQSFKLTLGNDDKLLLYSDGMVELSKEDFDVYGSDRFVESIQTNSHKVGDEFFSSLIADAKNWLGRQSLEEDDDIFMLVIGLESENTDRQFAVLKTSVDSESAAIIRQTTKQNYNVGLKPPRRFGLDELAYQVDAPILLVADHQKETDQFAQHLFQLGFETSYLNTSGFANRVSDELSDGAVICLYLNSNNFLTLNDWLAEKAKRNSNAVNFDYLILVCEDGKACEHFKHLSQQPNDYLEFSSGSHEIALKVYTGYRLLRLMRSVKKTTEELDTLRNELRTDLQKVATMQRLSFDTQTSYSKLVQTEWFSLPAEYVSGDFFQVYDLFDDTIGFYCIDAAGQGLLSAVKGWAVSRLLRGAHHRLGDTAVIDRDFSPAQVFNTVNQTIWSSRAIGRLVCSGIFGSLNVKTGYGSLACAGHPHGIILRANGEKVAIGTDDNALGLYQESKFQTVSFRLGEGDRLVLYTDGIFQAMGIPKRGEQVERCVVSLLEQAGKASLVDLRNFVESKLKTEGTLAKRDATLLLIQYGQLEELIPQKLPADKLVHMTEQFQQRGLSVNHVPKQAVEFIFSKRGDFVSSLVSQCSRFFATQSLNEYASTKLELVLTELLTNVKRHGQSKVNDAVCLTLITTDDSAIVHLSEPGLVIDQSKLDMAASHAFDVKTDDVNTLPEGGMGLPIIYRLMDEVRYRHSNGHNEFLLSMKVS